MAYAREWNLMRYFVCGMCGVIWAHFCKVENSICPDCGNAATELFRENYDEETDNDM